MYKFSCYIELSDLRTFMFCCGHLCYDMKCEEGESFLHVLWPLYQTFWRIEVFQSGFNISPATHRIPISTHTNPPLSLSLWKTEESGHWVFKHHLFKKISFPLNSPSTLVENKLIINLKFLFASWTFYSICLYFCFLKSIPSLITTVW